MVFQTVNSVIGKTTRLKPKGLLDFGMSLKGGGIIVLLLVAVALIGIGLNAIKGSQVTGETNITDTLGERTVSRDGVEYSVKEALGGEGVVCFGVSVPEGFNEGYANGTFAYNRLFVGSSGTADLNVRWTAVNFSVPEEGAICAVLDTEGNTVDKFLGFEPEKIDAARVYARGEQSFSMIKERTAYDMVEGKRALFDEHYLFTVCGNSDPLEGIGQTSDDHLDCLPAVENLEYASLADVLAGQTTAQATDLVGQIVLSNQGGFYVPKTNDEEVVVVSILGTTRIYPIYPLARYPVISEQNSELPYSITYDWLTDKVTIFKSSINGETTSLGFAGRVYNSNIVIYDYLTKSWYQQFNGLGLWGGSAGYQLDTLPYQRMSWADAKKLENAEYVQFYVGAETPDSLTVRAAEYKTSANINYIVSETVEDPKSEVVYCAHGGLPLVMSISVCEATEVSNNLGYQLFVNE